MQHRSLKMALVSVLLGSLSAPYGRQKALTMGLWAQAT
ncbi:gluconolactonase [Acetobacter orientalis]|uniref:Gluconolactonase n=1 Tax=Acetobacter orientalis TaxID=146474 RepID=A0A2Z5ZG50_9PROT|nr:gluconolactonase [Acetobacter orientalis]